MKKLAPLIITFAFLLVGCSAPAEDPAATDDGETSVSAEAPEATEKDRTEEFKDINAGSGWLGDVTTVTETEPGRLEVATSLVDPRGEDGSAKAQTAIEVCDAAVELVTDAESPYVSVLEADGTSWILYGHPSMTKGECGEV